uniref:Phosphonates import ATP-binding protein like n=1 Tax=Tanacetum cinerariifolium TaxID=118510 RepID=A0A6L2N1S4_TANCI|nr:phosphonates import ATP-binding protein like [Tanacetum cinerariifolium]
MRPLAMYVPEPGWGSSIPIDLFTAFALTSPRSYSYSDEADMQIERYYDGNGSKRTNFETNPPHNFRSYSVSYAAPPQTNMDLVVANKFDLKKEKSTAKSWSFNDPEFQRKKRVASYKVYSVEGKVKGSFRKSFRWLKDKYSNVVYGWWQLLNVKFESKKGLDDLLENGSYMIQNVPIILKKWSPDANLSKEDLTKLIMLDSYRSSMCMECWGRGSFARALIESDATCGLKEKLVVVIPKSEGSGYRMETIWPSISDSQPNAGKHKDIKDDGFQNVKHKTSKGGDWEIQGKSQGSGFTHSLPKRQMPKYAYQKKTTSTPVSNLYSALKEDNEKPKDRLMIHERRWRLLPRRLSERLAFERVGKQQTLLQEA